jgi:hypothetical protein
MLSSFDLRGACSAASKYGRVARCPHSRPVVLRGESFSPGRIFGELLSNALEFE